MTKVGAFEILTETKKQEETVDYFIKALAIDYLCKNLILLFQCCVNIRQIFLVIGKRHFKYVRWGSVLRADNFCIF